jgi:hypothetical protein
MKYFSIYFLNQKSHDQVEIKDTYLSKDDAINNIERVALDYIVEFNGKQQLEISKQYDRTTDQISSDQSLRPGLYLLKDNKENSSIILYEKINKLVPGTIWNSYETKMEKLGKFYYMLINLDNFQTQCTCNIPKNLDKKEPKNSQAYPYIDELLLALEKIRDKKFFKNKN